MVRFDLEQKIMDAWKMTDDLGSIIDKMESTEMTQEEILEYVKAVHILSNLRFDSLFTTFEDYIRNQQS